MFRHNFSYSLKILLRTKSLIFWVLLFPVILAIFFNMAFSGIENEQAFSPVDIAVVKYEAQNADGSEKTKQNAKIFEQAIASLGKKGDSDRTFNIKYTTKDRAASMLKDGKIEGYVVSGEKPSVVIRENGIEQTIIKSVVDDILVNTDIVTEVANRKIGTAARQAAMSGSGTVDTEKIYKDTVDEVMSQTANIRDTSPNNLSLTVIEFYTLIAMVCLYGGTVALSAMNKHLPNMDPRGQRTSVSRAGKLSLILSSAAAAWIVQLAGIAVAFMFIRFALGIDFGDRAGLILLLSVVGSLAGLMLGIAVSCTLKMSENAKDGFIIIVTMAGSFFSGMMGVDMKYYFDQAVPLLNKINPVAMITDGFYALYYYGGSGRFTDDLIGLIVFTAVMLVISLISLRRQRYDTI
ncbi:MAG: ABC transporter permease [Anaerovoracaceae bacterium]|jgi:ABC-2 type transport system permease protein